MRVLCVAEKPSIASSLASILSGGHYEQTSLYGTRVFSFSYKAAPPSFDDYVVTSVRGHLTEFDFSSDYRNWSSISEEALFDAPVYKKLTKDAANLEKMLQVEARRAQRLVIWTDCDREGEYIGDEVAQICLKVNPRLDIKRARFSAIIADQIHRAARNCVELDQRQVAAVSARSELDLRIGAAYTRFQTIKLRNSPLQWEQVVSYGPCQFPALGFVVDRYDRIQNFIPEPFWYIHLTLQRSSQSITFNWSRHHLFDYHASFIFFENCLDAKQATVTKIETKPTTKYKPYPLTTIDLQKSASSLLKMSPQNIMKIAEALYQRGFLSYPRTETSVYDPKFDFHRLIQKQCSDEAWGEYAQKLCQEPNPAFNKPRAGSKDDHAHPPIHPTAHVSNLVGDEKRVYDYICRRFLASCSHDAKGTMTTLTVEQGGEVFTTTGLVVLERNFLDVYPYEKWATNELPEFQQGEKFVPSLCELKEGSTTAPQLLTESDLVSLMDKNEIGTDATVADHIEKIILRDYVRRIKKNTTSYLAPSELGIGLVHGYNQIGFEKSLTKPLLRKESEQMLTMICEGRVQKNEVVQQSIHLYREVFARVRSGFSQHVIPSIQHYMSVGVAGTEGYEINPSTTTSSRGNSNSTRGRGSRATSRRGGAAGGTSRKRRRQDDDGGTTTATTRRRTNASSTPARRRGTSAGTRRGGTSGGNR